MRDPFRGTLRPMTMTDTTAAEATEDVAADRALRQLGAALREAGYTFTTVTPATHQRVNRRPANARARGLPDVLGWSRPFGPGILPERIVALMDAAGVLIRDGDVWRSRVRFSSYDGELF